MPVAVIFVPNVRDHRWLPVARSMPGEERAQAWSVTRVAIRCIALFALFLFLQQGLKLYDLPCNEDRFNADVDN
jgi:hypothetical protein